MIERRTAPLSHDATVRWWWVLARIAGAVVGGYAFSASMVALSAVLLPLSFGMARSEAVFLAAMLGFVIYLVVLLWAFAARRMWRVWAVLFGGALLGYGLASTIAMAF